MPRHFPYPSIGLFRVAVKLIGERCAYSGVSPKPRLRFKGAVKLHGVNTAVVLNSDGELHVQSREAIITPQGDLAGFAKWAMDREAEFRELLGPLLVAARRRAQPGDEPHTIALYGEWCGKGVQSGVAVSNLDKMFVAFGLARIRSGLVRENGEMVPGEILRWTPPGALRVELAPMVESGSVLCVEDFTTWEVEVDFERPEEAQARLVEITEAVEKQCPVGRLLGAEGVGEGVVWTCVTPSAAAGIPIDDLRFKVKGEKHSDNSTKDIAPVDVERLESVRACAELVGTEHRFEKGLDHLRAGAPGADVLSSAFVGPFLKWVAQDVAKEESDTIAANGLDSKEVGKAVAGKARAWFLGRQEQEQARARARAGG